MDIVKRFNRHKRYDCISIPRNTALKYTVSAAHDFGHRWFQHDKGLKVTGKVGEKTAIKL